MENLDKAIGIGVKLGEKAIDTAKFGKSVGFEPDRFSGANLGQLRGARSAV